MDIAKEYVVNTKEKYYETYEEWTKNGKIDINELLFRYLPGNTTMDEMGAIANSIYDSIEGFWANK